MSKSSTKNTALSGILSLAIGGLAGYSVGSSGEGMAIPNSDCNLTEMQSSQMGMTCDQETYSFAQSKYMEAEMAQIGSENSEQQLESTQSSTQEALGGDIIKGGRLHVCMLTSLMRSLNDGQVWVNYRFGNVSVDGEELTALFMEGGNKDPETGEVGEETFILRTGDQGFCPTVCDSPGSGQD